MPHSHPIRALVTGVTGQDGFYLSRLLLSRGAEVHAGVRAPEGAPAREAAAALPGLKLVKLDLTDPSSIAAALAVTRPTQIFHLAGMSSVAETWRDPMGAVMANTAGTLALLEAIRSTVPEAHLVFAGSGDTLDHEAAGPEGISPRTPWRCTNPYAITKAAAIQFVQANRKQFGLRASVAFMMNHTSPRRPLHYVERKIVHEACEIAKGRTTPMVIGSLSTRRDWSWADDIVEGLAALGSYPLPGDYVFSQGETHTTGDWVRLAFGKLGLEPERWIREDSGQLHKGDRPHIKGDIRDAARDLGWRPRTSIEVMVERLIEHEMGGAGAGGAA